MIIVVTAIILLLSIVGVIIVIRSMQGAARVALAVVGVLFSLVLIVVLAGQMLCFKFAANRVACNPKGYKGSTGQIITPLRGDLALSALKSGVGSRSRYMLIKSNDGTFILPAGRYRLMSCDQTITHNCVEWRLSTRIMRDINVLNGSKSHLDIGPPYTASVVVGKMRGDKASLNLNVIGRSNESCSIIGGAPPGFQILSNRGEVLQEGAFAYG